MKMPTRDEQQRILNFIDRDEWKYSWHLPSHVYGGIIWEDPIVEARIKKEILSARTYALDLLNDAAIVGEILERNT